MVTVVVKEGEKNHAVTVTLDQTLSELKDLLIRDHLGDHARGKRLRLISGGQVLKDGDALTSCGLRDGSFVHCAVSAMPPPSAPSTVDVLVQDLEEGRERRRGFDRFLDLGLDDEDIGALRGQFYPQVLEYNAQQPEREGEDARERVYRIEEEWIERQGPNSELGKSPTSWT